MRVSDLDGTQHFAVEALDDDGSVADSTRYAHDKFPLAASDYNHRTVDSLDPSITEVAEVGLRMTDAVAAFDFETFAALVHDDFVAIDHRPISYPELDRTQYVDAVLAQSNAIQVWLGQTRHAATSTAWLNTGCFWTINFGEWDPYEHGIYLNVVNNGKSARLEVYPDDQLEAALARFGELTALSEDTR